MPINLFNLFDAFWTDPSSLVWWSLIRWSGDSVIVNPVFPGNPSVTQSLFRLFSLLWNIPCPFLHHNRSKYNFKPSYSNLILRANWLVWCLNRIYQLNQSRSRCKCSWDATIVYLTHAILEKQLTALNVVHTFHLFNWYVFILLTKTRTETKTVPSTWYVFNVQACTHTDFHLCAIYCHWLTWGTGPTNIHTPTKRKLST